jgi:hypothetical protein
MNNLISTNTSTLGELHHKQDLPTDIKHLLARSLVGIFPGDRKIFLGKSRKEVLDILLHFEPLLDNKPLKDYDSIQAHVPDARVEIGKTWVFDYNHDAIINDKRKYSLRNWVMGVLYSHNSLSLMPRMFLFWIDFFSLDISKIPFPSKTFRHYDILRLHALGNFGDLLTNFVTDPGWIYYLKRTVPGHKKIYEYAAHRFFENYTIGSGFEKIISKEKIKRLARLLSKWHLICDSAPLHYSHLRQLDIYKEENRNYLDAYFNRAGTREVLEDLRYLISQVLEQPLAAQNLSERLLSFFLAKDIPNDAGEKIIEPLAESLLKSGFDLSIGLRKIFMNDYFYKPQFRSNKEKDPLEFLFKMSKQLEIIQPVPDDFSNYSYWDWLRHKADEWGQPLLTTPVKNTGSDESKVFPGEQWLSPFALQERYLLVDRLLDAGIMCKDKLLTIDVQKLLQHCSDPANPYALTDELVQQLYEVSLSLKQKRLLAERYLLSEPTNPSEWTILWQAADQNNDSRSGQEIRERLNRLIRFLLTQPEYSYY